MKTFALKAEKRDSLGKKSTRTLRKQNHVPCVMYGGEEINHFHVHENAVKKLIYTDQVYLVEIEIAGKTYKSVMHELQFHPVTDKTLHIDFVQVFEDKPSVVSLPINLTGTSKGIIAGGKLRLKKRYLKVKGLVKDMPETLNIDISPLQIGDSLKVGDLKYENLELLEPAQAMVVGIASSRLAAKSEEEIAIEEAAEEAAAETAAAAAEETTTSGE
jgi:large subunit ribosomal protein L25